MRLTRCFNFAGKVFIGAFSRSREETASASDYPDMCSCGGRLRDRWFRGTRRGKGSLDHHLGCHTCSALVG